MNEHLENIIYSINHAVAKRRFIGRMEYGT